MLPIKLQPLVVESSKNVPIVKLNIRVTIPRINNTLLKFTGSLPSVLLNHNLSTSLLSQRKSDLCKPDALRSGCLLSSSQGGIK